MQDPLIAGDAGKAGKRLETDEATVDEAGQIRRKSGEVDLFTSCLSAGTLCQSQPFVLSQRSFPHEL